MISLIRLGRAAVASAALFFLAANAPDPVRETERVPMASAAEFGVWTALAPGRAAEVNAFQAYLAKRGVANIFPMHQLLRSDSAWAQCSGEPFTLPPRKEWTHIIGTLKFIRDRVIPRTGKLEVVSGYRAPAVNRCAGGASQSAHVEFWALDLVPSEPIVREQMIAQVCSVHAAYGGRAGIGLGFYSGRRFHIDSRSFRRWGSDYHAGTSPCIGITG